MKTPTSLFMFSIAGCISITLTPIGMVSSAHAADATTTSLSLLQQPALADAVAKATAAGTTAVLPTPAALALVAQKGQTAVGTITLHKGGTDRHTYYLSTNQSWVWMNPPYGSTQTITTEVDQLVITAQTANLPIGTHSAVVYVVDSGPNNFTNMLRVPVTLTVTAAQQATAPPPPPASPPPAPVTPPPAPVVPQPTPVAVTPPPPTPVAPPPAPPITSTGIASNPMALALTAPKGQTAMGTLTLRKGGTAQHSYYLSTNQSWVWMNPPYGSTQTITTEVDQLVITAQTANLPIGTHSAVVYVVDSGPNNFTNMLRVPVTLTVTAAQQATAPPPPPASPPPAPVTPPPAPVVPQPTPVAVTPPPPTPVAPPPAPPAPQPSVSSPIQATPTALALTSAKNVGTISLKKSGTAQHSYLISASQSWIWMNPPYGSTQTITTETDSITVTAYTASLPAGTHSGVIYIVESGPNGFTNTLRIPVTVTVSSTQTADNNPTAPSQPTATTPPPPPPSPTAPPPVANAPGTTTPRTATATVSWNANSEQDLAGYRVYVGTRSGSYNFAGPFEVTKGTSFTVPNLPVGTTYFFAVSAFDKSGNESAKSVEVSKSLF
ncbi:MAG: hypothetical protein AMXMBFR67_03040 [Nitrospira sp.]